MRALGGAIAVSAMLLATAAAAPAQAQYADGGVGLYRGSIDWFEWGSHGEAIPADGMQRANTRTIAGQDLVTTCTISDIDGELEVYRPGTWHGDALDELYNVAGTGDANQLVTGIVNAHHHALDSFRLSCGVTLDGVDVPIDGLVVADAEASNEAVPAVGSLAEYIEARPEQPSTWRIIDRYRAPGCTATTVATRFADDTVRFGTDGRECVETPAGGSGPMVVGFMEGATSAEVTLQGGGRSAIAVGVVLHTDFGDAPAGYGAAGALFEPRWTGGTLPEGRTAVSDDSFALATLGPPALRLGDLIDAESAPIFSDDARGDDEDGESDEDAVSLPAEGIAVIPGRPFTLDPVRCAGDGLVAGWIDWTRRGSFAPEDRSDIVACRDGAVALTWDVPVGADGSADESTFLRLRIGADEAALADATGLTRSGEVEDHALAVRLSQPAITAAKTAAPASGSAVELGETVEYTLSFANDGDGPGVVDYVDDVSGVLDDADLVGIPRSSDPALSVTRLGDRFRITGSLEAGQVVHITYSAVVRESGEGGDHTLHNVLAPSTIDDPECDVDGVLCTDHSVPNLAWWKQVKADTSPVTAGTALTYTLFFENSGTADAPLHAVDHLGFASDDLAFDTAPRSTDPLTALRDGDVITITGSVPAGATYSVSYDGVVKPDAERGDDLAVNFLRAPGDPVPSEPVCRTAGTERPDCTVTPIGRAIATKAVDDAAVRSGEGSVLSYTLQFQNESAEDALIDYVDHLDDVLDDADLVSAPSTSNDAVTVGPVADGKFRIRGTVPAGQSAKVVYDVALKGEGEHGDHLLTNFLTAEGHEPPVECLPDDSTCTVTPLPALRVEKTSDPGSETPVAPGETVTYTISFTNDGAAPADVDHVDDLSDVLDDAALAETPTGSIETVSVELGDDDVLRMLGSIEPGGRVDVTYSVVVGATVGSGDGLLRNTVVPAGGPVPEECIAGQCTRHPVLFPVEPAAGQKDAALATTGAMLPFAILGGGVLLLSLGGALIGRRKV